MKRRRSGILLGVVSWIGGHRMLISAAPCVGVDTPITIRNQTGLNTLREAVSCTDGGQVEALWVGFLTVDVTITIGSGTFLTVSGRESAEASATSDVRLFDASSLAGLAISNMTLSNGVATEGGAINSNLSTVRVERCILRDHMATEGGGGAISAMGGSLTIVSSTFTNNVASDKGGAVQAIDLALSVTHETLFQSNKASEGGGVFCAGSYSLSPQSTANCSFDDVSFESNNSSREVELDFGDWGWESPFSFPWGGGGLSLANTTGEVKRCTFDSNIAQLSGGGLFAGKDANLTVDSCNFLENRCEGYGGGMTAGTATLAGDTLFDSNWAGRDGAGVFLWNPDGLVDFNFATCRDNEADDRGGCMFTRGITTVGEEVVMSGDSGGSGGCIYVFDTSNTVVEGGKFTCSTSGNGAFLYAGDGAVVNVTGGLVTGCVAARRAGVAYCKGDSEDLVGAKVTISGGTFVDNQALELGGALAAWGTTVNVLGGFFSNNTARYYGGFVFLEEEASLICEGATIKENHAHDQGGGVYARDAVNVTLSGCDLLDNVSPQGAAAYLTHVELASFHDLSVSGNMPSSGASVFIAQSLLIADGVNFDAGNASMLDATNRAVQSDASSSFHAHDCTFEDWDGDAVVSHGGQSSSSLKLNTCDFRNSSSSTVVISSKSEAEIRNAHVSQDTFDNAIDPFALVDNALSCSSQGACGDGVCVNSSLGVLCECLPLADGGACLDDSPTLWLEEASAPADATIYPQNVEFTLAVYADTDGSTDAIWELASSSDRLELSVVPSSGVISPGEKTVIAVTGVPVDVNTGGDVTNTFVLTTVTNGSNSSSSSGSSSTGLETVDTVRVTSAVYLCDAFEVAMPDDSAVATCGQCSELEGGEGLDCEEPGATLELLPILPGYWRSSTESTKILSCNFADACAGGVEVMMPDGYCAPGHVGPYCAVCDEGYGRGMGDRCHSCDGVQATLLFTLGSIFFLFLLCFLALTVVFLIGGLDAVDSVRETMVSMVTFKRRASSRRCMGPPVEDGMSVSSKGSSKGESIRSIVMTPSNKLGRELRGDGGHREHKTCDVEDNGPGREEPQQTPGETADSGMRDASHSEAQPAPMASAMTPARPASRPLLVKSVDKLSGRKRERRVPLSNDPLNDLSNANEDEYESRSGCCGLGNVIKRWMSRLPLDKLKILVVVWQILTVFPSIASVEFPPAYANFLSWIDVINLDLGHIFSASCLITNVTHYERLLAVTLIPLLLGLVLMITYRMALGRAGIGRAGISARRAAFSRHMAAGLLLTFLVFTSTSTMIFRTFSCDYNALEGKGYLIADYSVECDTVKHTIFRVYAAFMMLIYPIGIPVLYFYILWSNRESLNPKLAAASNRAEAEAEAEVADESGSGEKKYPVPAGHDDAKELEEKILRRREDPKLVPSMFLWKDFGPDLYYYEVIECGRRILLTGVLIFIAPQTSTQAAMACLFAFASLLGFELLRPHLDPTDSWLYRLGCVVIFLSNFLALLIKVDAAGSDRRNVLGALIVLVNVILIVAVIVTSWFATQQSVDDSRSEDNSLAVVRTMVTVERLGSGRRMRSTKIEPSSSTTPFPIGTVSPSLCIRPIASNDPVPARGMRFFRGNGGHVGGGAIGNETPGSTKRTRVRTRDGKDITEELWRKSQGS